jgi:hypothetical protein
MADPARFPTSHPRFRQPAALWGALRSAAEAAGRYDFSPLWAGQSFPLSQNRCPQQLDTDARWRKHVGFGTDFVL